MKRSIYGLNDAPRAWYDKVRSEMKRFGATVSKFDKAVFMWHENDKLIGLLVSHVDDFSFAGTDAWEQCILKKIKTSFSISLHQTDSFRYLGLIVKQENKCVTITQDLYIQTITPINIKRNFIRNDVMDVDERRYLKQLAGQMLWVSSQTRPDMAFEVCIMCNTGKSPTMKKILEANKAVSKMKSRNLQLRFGAIEDVKKIEILSYTDATHASLDQGASQGAHLIVLRAKDGLNPICWQSKKLDRITRSPLASEASAVSDGADAAYLIRSQLLELFPTSEINILCNTDSESLVETVKTTRVHNDKRLVVDIGRIKEIIEHKEISLKWIPGKEQLADAMTKRGASTDLLICALRM